MFQGEVMVRMGAVRAATLGDPAAGHIGYQRLRCPSASGAHR